MDFKKLNIPVPSPKYDKPWETLDLSPYKEMTLIYENCDGATFPIKEVESISFINKIEEPSENYESLMEVCADEIKVVWSYKMDEGDFVGVYSDDEFQEAKEITTKVDITSIYLEPKDSSAFKTLKIYIKWDCWNEYHTSYATMTICKEGNQRMNILEQANPHTNEMIALQVYYGLQTIDGYTEGAKVDFVNSAAYIYKNFCNKRQLAELLGLTKEIFEEKMPANLDDVIRIGTRNVSEQEKKEIKANILYSRAKGW